MDVNKLIRLAYHNRDHRKDLLKMALQISPGISPEITEEVPDPRAQKKLEKFEELARKRLQDAIDFVYKRRKKGDRWVLQNRYSGRTFFEMEKVSQPSRWNTLRALRVLRWWEG